MVSLTLETMRIGVPKEIKVGETRVAVSPKGVATLVQHGHDVFVQVGAGNKCGWSDLNYRDAGAKMLHDLESVYRRADLICKVKEPQPVEIPLLRKLVVLFTFFHFAGYPRLLSILRKKEIVAIAYETIETKGGKLPILAPMSEIAGSVSVLLGAEYLRSDRGGKGLLLAPTGKKPRTTVGIIGCGNVGEAAIRTALGFGASVIAADKDPVVLKKMNRRYGKKLEFSLAGKREIARLVRRSDLLIGAVLLHGRRAPRVVTRQMVCGMEKGSVIVDVSIDQGGCVETTRPTNIEEPIYRKYGVIHSAIPNMPALVPRTASRLLSEQVEPYLLKLADEGWEKATQKDPSLAKGLNLVGGEVVYPGLL